MDIPTLTRADALLSKIATAHKVLAKPRAASATGVDDLAWIEYSGRRATLLGAVTEFLTLQELLCQQEANDKPYDEIMVQRAKMLQADIAAGNTYSSDYSEIGSRRDAIEGAIARVTDITVDRRHGWKMRPLPFGFYAAIAASDLDLPLPFLRYVLTLPRYCHLIGGVTPEAICATSAQYAMGRLLREEINFGNFLCESHRSVFRLGDQRWPDLGMAYLPPSAEIRQTGAYFKPIASSIYFCGESINARGLYSQASFDARFAAFTGGMFAGLQDARLYFCGSMLPACAMRTPQEQLFYNWLPLDHDADPETAEAFWAENATALGAYFDEFYRDSDIDIIADVVSDAGLDSVLDVVIGSIGAWYRERNSCEMPADAILVLREQANKSYRYSITGSILPRPIQLFRKHFITPMGLVNSFHMACVRAYYHAGEVRMSTSFIIAAQTGICVDLRYINVSKDVAEVLIKYWRRGWYGGVVAAELGSLDARIRDKYPSVAENVTGHECWRISAPHWITGTPLRYVNEDTCSLGIVKSVRDDLLAEARASW